jgi:defect-in-organelle-trafficking protein DotA
MKIFTALLLLILFSPFASADIVVSSGQGTDIYGALPEPPAAAAAANAAAAAANTAAQAAASAVGNAAAANAAAASAPTSSSSANVSVSSTNFSPSSSFGTNNAELTALLTPPATDLSLGYLSAIFGLVDGVLPGGGNHQILGKMFSIFNSVVLALGGVVLMYVLIVSTINTAQEGDIMGKDWSSIWIPMKTAVGIGFLVPKASGYSVVQILMMWIVTQGIGAADSVWNATLDYLNSGGTIVSLDKDVPPSAATDPETLTAAIGTLSALTCMSGIEQIYKYIQRTNPSLPSLPSLYSTLKVTRNATGMGGFIDFPGVLPSPFSAVNKICGTMTWNVANANDNTVMDAATLQMVADLSGAASQLATAAVNSMMNGGITPDITTVDVSPIMNAVVNYKAIALSTTPKDQGNPDLTNGITVMKQNGWIMAGAYFFTLSKITSATSNALTPPSVSGGITDITTQNSIVANFSSANITTDQIGKLLKAYQDYLALAKAQQPVFLPPVNKGIAGMPPQPGTASSALIMDPIKQRLNQAFQGNPIVALANIGADLIILSLTLWGAGAAFAMGAAATIAALSYFVPAIGSLVDVSSSWVLPLISPIILAGLTAGGMLAFYIPLIPFILFTFGAIGWLVGVVETMVAAPLVALGLMSPEGDKIFGRASPAIMLVTSVFLRPTLMLFGYISGIIMSYVSLWLLAQGFMYIVLSIIQINSDKIAAGVGVGSAALGLLAFPLVGPAALYVAGTSAVVMFAIVGLVFVLIYAFLAVMVIQKAFELINIVPDAVLRWIGGTDKGPGAHYGEGMGQQAEQKAQAGSEKGAALGHLDKKSMNFGERPKPKGNKDKGTAPGGDAGGAGDAPPPAS